MGAAKVDSVGQPDVLLCPQCRTLSQHPTLAVVLHVSGLQETPTGLHSHSRSAIRCCGFVLRTASLRRARVLPRSRGFTLSARFAIGRLRKRHTCGDIRRRGRSSSLSLLHGTTLARIYPVSAAFLRHATSLFLSLQRITIFSAFNLADLL